MLNLVDPKSTAYICECGEHFLVVTSWWDDDEDPYDFDIVIKLIPQTDANSFWKRLSYAFRLLFRKNTCQNSEINEVILNKTQAKRLIKDIEKRIAEVDANADKIAEKNHEGKQ